MTTQTRERGWLRLTIVLALVSAAFAAYGWWSVGREPFPTDGWLDDSLVPYLFVAWLAARRAPSLALVVAGGLAAAFVGLVAEWVGYTYGASDRVSVSFLLDTAVPWWMVWATAPWVPWWLWRRRDEHAADAVAAAALAALAGALAVASWWADDDQVAALIVAAIAVAALVLERAALRARPFIVVATVVVVAVATIALYGIPSGPGDARQPIGG